MPEQPNTALAGIVQYYDARRKEQRDIEDDEMTSKIALLHDLIKGPGANPVRTAQGLGEIQALIEAKGSKRKPSKGMKGFMGGSEIPDSQLLAGLIHGSIPMQGPTTEAVPMPQTPQQQGLMPEASAILPRLQGFDGQEILQSPVMIPPEPIQAPPIDNGPRLLSAARDMQRYNEGPKTRPVANQPMFRSPEEMAQQEGQAAGLKAGAAERGKMNAKREIGKELGLSDERIGQSLLRDWEGSSSDNNFTGDSTPEVYTDADGNVITRYVSFDRRTGKPSYQDIPAPPGSTPYAKQSAAGPGNFNLGDIIRHKNEERKAAGLPPLSADEELKIQNEWQQNGAPRVGVTIRNEQGLSAQNQFQNEQTLAKEWIAATKDQRTIVTNAARMQKAKEFLNNPKLSLNAPAQTIINTFNRILDPASVVRESEYARTPEGQSLANQIAGRWDALWRGGPGMTIGELKAVVQLTEQFLSINSAWVDNERQRIQAAATQWGLNSKAIFGPNPGAGLSLPNQGQGNPAIPQPQYKVGDKKVAPNGRVLYFDGKIWGIEPVLPAPPARR